MKALIVILCLCLSSAAWAVTHPDEKLRNPALEARAMALTTQLRCVVCQNESIEDSQADIARDLRIIVRKRLLAGESDADIKTFLQTRYGDYILLDPPVAPRTWALWLAPLIVLTGGAILIARTIPRRKRKHP